MKRSLIAGLALVALILLLPGCDERRSTTPRIDHQLERTKDTKQRIELLQQAQKQYGPKETSK